LKSYIIRLSPIIRQCRDKVPGTIGADQLPGVEFFGAEVVGCNGWLFAVGCRDVDQVLREKRADD
jgi:hypothetical protein